MEYLDTGIEPQRSSPFKSALWGFGISVIVLLILLVWQLLYKYNADIFGKDFGFFLILKLVVLTSVSLMILVLPVSVLLFAVIFYKEKFRNADITINSTIRKSLFPVFAFSISVFVFMAWINPKVNLHMNGLLFDMRMAEKGKPFQRTNLQLFKDSYTLCNINRLSQLQDSLEMKIDNIKSEAVTWLTAHIDSAQLFESLIHENALGLGLTKDDFKNREWFKQSSTLNYKLTQHDIASTIFEIYQSKLNYDSDRTKILTEKYRMMAFPVMIFLIIYFGMFTGTLIRNGRYLPLIILLIYLVFYPLIMLLSSLATALPKHNVVSPGASQIYFLLIMLIITTLMYILARRSLRVTSVSS
jgi:hypothetical protein